MGRIQEKQCRHLHVSSNITSPHPGKQAAPSVFRCRLQLAIKSGVSTEEDHLCREVGRCQAALCMAKLLCRAKATVVTTQANHTAMQAPCKASPRSPALQACTLTDLLRQVKAQEQQASAQSSPMLVTRWSLRARPWTVKVASCAKNLGFRRSRCHSFQSMT